MKISVIVPTYKPQEYIYECLDSLKNQTFNKNDFEIIIVLNGCYEPFYSQIKEYISTKIVRYNINFIHTNEGGVSNARNIALDVAKGEYITFIDDDDYISPKYLEELYSKATPNTISIAYPYAFKDGSENQIKNRLTILFEKQSKLGKQSYRNIRSLFSGPCMKLFHTDIINNRKFNINFKNGEDSLYMFLISDRFKYVDFTSTDAIYYRRFRIGSAVYSNRNRLYLIKNGFKLMLCYCKIYLSNPIKYSPKFFLTRILATLNGILHNI